MTRVIQLMIVALIATSLNGNVIEDIKDGINKASDAIEESSLCLTSEGCAKSFFSINNYCCPAIPGIPSGTCCNVAKYVTRNNEYWQNLVDTVKNPRGINIIIGVSIAIIVLLIIGLVIQLICCLCCGCCGSKKYVIVGRGD